MALTAPTLYPITLPFCEKYAKTNISICLNPVCTKTIVLQSLTEQMQNSSKNYNYFNFPVR